MSLISSIERTLFPDDSEKSVKILLLKAISLERILLPSEKFKLFSVAISKSNTQLRSINPSKLLTIVTSVNCVVIPTVNGWFVFVASICKSPNFLYPRVWFIEDIASFQVSNGTVLFKEYEKFW